MIEIEDVHGLWERSLIAWPDGRQDASTFVAWLQGPSLFSDLRQPAGLPSFDGVTCLKDLLPHDLAWLSRQEGFAGRFVQCGDAFEWRRMIDFQCPSEFADAGYLSFSDSVLIERGRDIPYVEHWHRAASRVLPHFALRLMDEVGTEGFLIRMGDVFMYARNRAEALPRGSSLAEMVARCSLEEGQGLVDCEISLGRIQDASWRIQRSSLPFRVNVDLSPAFAIDGERLATADISAQGTLFVRQWKIVDIDGSNENLSGLRSAG
jgi:hypothetical protein